MLKDPPPVELTPGMFQQVISIFDGVTIYTFMIGAVLVVGAFVLGHVVARMEGQKV